MLAWDFQIYGESFKSSSLNLATGQCDPFPTSGLFFRLLFGHHETYPTKDMLFSFPCGKFSTGGSWTLVICIHIPFSPSQFPQKKHPLSQGHKDLQNIYSCSASPLSCSICPVASVMAQNRFLQSPGFENIVSVSTMFPALCLQHENRSQQKGGRIPEDTLGQIFFDIWCNRA